METKLCVDRFWPTDNRRTTGTVCSIAGAAHRNRADAGRRGVERSGFARFAPLRIGAMPVLVQGFAEFAEFARGNVEMRVFIEGPLVQRLPWPWGGRRSLTNRAPTGCVRRCGRLQRCGWGCLASARPQREIHDFWDAPCESCESCETPHGCWVCGHARPCESCECSQRRGLGMAHRHPRPVSSEVRSTRRLLASSQASTSALR